MESQNGEQVGGTGDLDKFLAKHDEQAVKYTKLIEEMLGDYERFNWAEDTLIGIYDHVLQNNSITEGQIRAVENIREAGYNPQRRW